MSLFVAGVCLAAGIWLFAGAERRHRSTAPEEEAAAEVPRKTATLEAAAAAEVDRRVAANGAGAKEAAMPVAAPLGAVAGSFFAPRSLTHDAKITLHALQWFEDDDSIHRRKAHFPVSEPWRLENLAAGHWRFAAEVTLDDRRWSSAWFDLELGEGAERRGVALTLVECCAEGVVTDRAGIAVPGAEIEITSARLILDDGRRKTRPPSNELRKVRASLASRVSSYQATAREVLELRTELKELLSQFEGDDSATIELSGPPTTVTHDERDEDRILPRRWTTDASGRYRVPLVGPGAFGLRLVGDEWIAEEAHVEVDHDRPVATHHFEVARASSLSGRVVAAGGTLPEVVQLFLRLGQVSEHTRMGPDGTFRFERRAPGRYDFYARGGGDAGQDWSHHAKLELAEGIDAFYEVPLEPTFDVEGQVVDPDRQPEIHVVAESRNDPSVQRQALVRADGTFTLRGLPAGTYDLSVRDRRLLEEHSFTVDAAHPAVHRGLELLPRGAARDE